MLCLFPPQNSCFFYLKYMHTNYKLFWLSVAGLNIRYLLIPCQDRLLFLKMSFFCILRHVVLYPGIYDTLGYHKYQGMMFRTVCSMYFMLAEKRLCAYLDGFMVNSGVHNESLLSSGEILMKNVVDGGSVPVFYCHKLHSGTPE